MRRQRVPILVYGDDEPELLQAADRSGAGVVAQSQFFRQMRYIADDGWRVVSTTQVVEWVTGDGSLSEKALVLHFDNGWLDTFTVTFRSCSD